MKIKAIISLFLIILTFFLFLILIGSFFYLYYVYFEYAANKNAIFDKIERFVKEFGKDDTDIFLGLDDKEEKAKETIILDRKGNIIAKYSPNRHRLIQLKEIPNFISIGFILIEDQQFFNHKGINTFRIFINVINNIFTLGKAGGGSTISQQLSKILFTKHERTLKRKVYEMFCTFEMEKKFSKKELLTIYLNSIYLGHGTYGIQDAANFYFGKDAAELNIAEGALLIGMNRSPENYSPIKYRERAENIQRVVMNSFIKYGYITKEDADFEIQKFWKKFDETGVAGNQSFWKTSVNNSAYITEYIRQILEKEFDYDKITKGGLIIETTIDLERQRLAESIVKTQLKHIRAKIKAKAEELKLTEYDDNLIKKVEASLTSIDFKKGEILVLVGGSGYTFANQLNRAVQSYRQIGSSVKPLIYLYALNQKNIGEIEIHPFSKFKDEIVTYTIAGKKYTPKNYHYNHQYGDMVTLYDALKRSLNTIAVKVLNLMNIKDVAEFIRKASYLTDEKNAERIPEVLSLGLGVCELSTLELATAYSIIPNYGKTKYPYLIKRIYDDTGNIYYDIERENNPYFNFLYPAEKRVSEQLIKPEVAYEVIQMMRSVFEPGGTGYGAAFKTGFNVPSYGKSGTTQDYRDGIFAGFTNSEVCVTWVGIDTNQSIFFPSESNAALIWCDYIKNVSKGLTEPLSPPMNTRLLPVCMDTGLIAGPNCKNIKNFYFWLDGPIPEKCYIHNNEIEIIE